MNSPESTDAARNDEQAAGLWRGDAGGLKLDARRALVQLLKGPVLDGMRMPVIWKALLESEDLIRSRLNDLFLDLVIDREQLFAFTRQADTDPVKAPILLKRKPLNYIETYLFLFLRLRLSSAEGRGERAVIGLDEIREHLADIAGRNRDAVGFERHLAGAVTKADHFGVLRRLKSGEDAFEISPVLKMLMTADLVEQVKGYYEGRAAKPGEAAAEIPAGIENDESEDRCCSSCCFCACHPAGMLWNRLLPERCCRILWHCLHRMNTKLCWTKPPIMPMKLITAM